MKAILATALILALGITGISLWGAVHARRMPMSSSQIFIHGTPVCVRQHAGEIHASVGICAAPRGEPLGDDPGNGGGFHGGMPFSHDQDMDLPPGHPPIDGAPDFGEGRRVLI